MKYISLLSKSQLINLVKIYTKSSFKELLEINTGENGIEITVIVELDDDESDNGKITLEESYTFYDYDVKIWDYQANNRKELLHKYRLELLNHFGNQYALDYLLGE